MEKPLTIKKEESKESPKTSLIDQASKSFTTFIYSKDKKIERILLILVIVGFILRIIAAMNLSVLADDMVYASQSAGIISSKIISTHSNPPLFFYLTDLIYKIIGPSTLSSRFWSLIAGTFLIILSYLITTKLFNKKIGLFAAFFVTFSGFLIRMTFTEMSLLVLFFYFTGIYLGILFFEKKKPFFIISSAICFGVGILSKYSAPFFILAFLIFSLVFLKTKKENIFTKKNILYLVLFLAIILLFSLPFLAFNYLIYSDKGITDVYFSRIIQTPATQQIYQGLGGQERSFFDNAVMLNSYGNYSLIFKTDIALFIFGLLGFILLCIKKNKLPIAFILIFLLIPFFLQSPGSPLPKHFVFMHFIFAIPAAYFLNESYNKLRQKNKILPYMLMAILILIMLVNLGNGYSTPSSYISASPESQLKSYISHNVKSDDLIVFDDRIYTSQIFWFATPNHFLTMLRFTDLYNYNLNISDQYKIPVNVYFIECVKQDCGWGTIKDQPELNQSLEYLFSGIKQSTALDKTISGSKYSGNEFFSSNEKTQTYRVYKSTIYLNPLLTEQTDRINSFYFVPYLYKDLSDYLYNYEVKSLFGRLLEQLSRIIILVSMLATLFVFILVLYLLIKRK